VVAAGQVPGPWRKVPGECPCRICWIDLFFGGGGAGVAGGGGGGGAADCGAGERLFLAAAVGGEERDQFVLASMPAEIPFLARSVLLAAGLSFFVMRRHSERRGAELTIQLRDGRRCGFLGSSVRFGSQKSFQEWKVKSPESAAVASENIRRQESFGTSSGQSTKNPIFSADVCRRPWDQDRARCASFVSLDTEGKHCFFSQSEGFLDWSVVNKEKANCAAPQDKNHGKSRKSPLFCSTQPLASHFGKFHKLPIDFPLPGLRIPAIQ
jgi:hypothetical protein